MTRLPATVVWIVSATLAALAQHNAGGPTATDLLAGLRPGMTEFAAIQLHPVPLAVIDAQGVHLVPVRDGPRRRRRAVQPATEENDGTRHVGELGSIS